MTFDCVGLKIDIYISDCGNSSVGRVRLCIHQTAGIAQLVEHDLAKVGVAGSNPVSRSNKIKGLRYFLDSLSSFCDQIVTKM